MNDIEISVALAAYKGEKFIAEQLSSILSQLPPGAEVIVSDDCPGGETEKIVKSFAAEDARVRYVEGGGRGVTANFENALRECRGRYVFLADQDDVWLPGKVEKVTALLKDGACLVLHDCSVTDAELNITEPSFFACHASKNGFINNLIRNSFVGCCMAFDSELLSLALPFPDRLPMHDWWLALTAMKHKKRVVLLPEPLILWRRHGGTVTGKKNPVVTQLRWRLRMAALLAVK